MQAVRYYDFTLGAGGSQVITAEGAYFRVQSATGALNITVEGAGTIPSMLVGQGLKDIAFKRLVIQDASGSANVGQILIAGKEFVDNRTYGVTSLTGQQGAFTNSQKAVTNSSNQLLAANANRRYLLIQNNDPVGIIYVRLDGGVASSSTGVTIQPGGSYELQGYVTSGAITAIGSIPSQSNVVVVEG